MRRAIRTLRQRPALVIGVSAGVVIAALILGAGLWMLFNQAVVHQAVSNDLVEIDQHLSKSEFQAAKSVVERAKARLGTSDSAVLGQELRERLRDCDLGSRLERINLDSAITVDGVVNFHQADKAFDEAFQEFGFGRNGDDPMPVATRVRGSRVCRQLLAALDNWSVVAGTQNRSNWTLDVAKRVEPQPTEWRTAVRDPKTRRNRAILLPLLDRADVGSESSALLLALSSHLTTKYRYQSNLTAHKAIKQSLFEDSKHQIPFLTKVQRAHPNDLWANFYLGYTLLAGNKPGDAVRYFQAVVALRPELMIGYHQLGLAIKAQASSSFPQLYDEAAVQFRKALEIDPKSAVSQVGLIGVLEEAGKLDEAIKETKKALQFKYYEGGLRASLGANLYAKGLVEESLTELRAAFSLEPNDDYVVHRYRRVLTKERLWDELRRAWATTLQGNRPNHNDRYGFAELCLFLGREEDYHQARKALLERFGTSNTPHVAERTARACLLFPATDDVMNKCIALTDYAAKTSKKDAGVYYPYYQFVKGLAEYRQGHFEKVIAIMRGDASKMIGPLPQLLLSMALHQSGKNAEARQTFSLAILNCDWRDGKGEQPDCWIRHIVRREAEKMIYPNLTSLKQTTQQPRDNDERLALIGVCQFENRYSTLARIYADAFVANPGLTVQHRFAAARVAAQAGCGLGIENAIPKVDRIKWRVQARKWLEEELSAKLEALDRDYNKSRNSVRQALTGWLNDPDFRCIRESPELGKLSPDEKEAFQKLWASVQRVHETTK